MATTTSGVDVKVMVVIMVVVFIDIVTGEVKWNQTSQFRVGLDFTGWSNFSPLNGGCVSCPYTCVRPSAGPDGVALNFSNASLIASLPSVYSQPVSNGCCYASKSKSKVMPDCNNVANPVTAEDCGFLYGPTLNWNVTSGNPPNAKTPYRAVMFASTDCMNFWAVQQTYIKMEGITASVKISGKKQINGGCFGSATGSAIVLAGCLTNMLKFDKSMVYTWDQLASKCNGLSGKCTRTNALWGANLKCCSDPVSITNSEWNLKWPDYNKSQNTGITLSGPAVCGIVFGGVAFMMALVHFGSKIHRRAKQTALMREQEATDDYEEIMTPLTGGDKKPLPLTRPIGPAHLEVSLHEGDQIFKPKEDEVLFEGDMY